jgi:hypothetical protein
MSSPAPEAGSPQAVMFALLKQYLHQTPFEPFRIVTTSGRAYDVPTADHAVLFPMLRTVTIADDSDGSLDIHTLHIATIERLKRRRSRSAKAA